MRKLYIAGGLVLATFLFSCEREPVSRPLNEDLIDKLTKISPNGSLSFFVLPDSDDYTQIPQSPSNPLTPEKIALGKMLFFEPAFGVEAKHQEGNQTFSCSTCHVPEAGFRPNRIQGIADGGVGFGTLGDGRSKYPFYADSEIDAQGARPLSVLNVAFVSNTMWNGSFGSDQVNAGTESLWGVFDPGTAINNQHLGALEGQNIEGLKTHRLQYTPELVEQFGYKYMFDQAFPDVPVEERYSRKTASFAISAYLRQLLCSQAPFQEWLKGNEFAMTDEQKKGAVLFFGKAGCANCHNQPNLGSITFHGIGVEDLYENGGLKTDANDRRNLGRGGFTGAEEDMFRFRVPQLYNLADSGPYFHGSSKSTLRDAIEYFNVGLPENPRVPKERISPFFHPLYLNEREIDALEAFIGEALHDPNLKRYVPEHVQSGMCFPNNDPLSKIEMGCN